ncbi:MAG: hypothetical protein CMP95_02765 [Gammaproteobacteria bacterium]|nr:hypothetical protein [Gammaproteobacteria bacterium]|tara:strand:+ start:27125 stop:27961 length:837 start_codon:yes stop_codon:yes gene_type:complete
MTTNSKHHWFPLYHDAWVIGTLDLTFQQQGLYLRLLLMQFNDGYVDTVKFERIYPAMNEQEQDDYRLVMEYFFEQYGGGGDEFKNLRLEKVMAEQEKKTVKRGQQTKKARAAKKKKLRTGTDNVTGTVTEPAANNVTEHVTETVTERELELELERELELELEQEKELSAPTVASGFAIEIAVQKWNEAAATHKNLAKVRAITDKRRRAWRTASKKPGFLANWEASLEKLPVHNHGSFSWQPTFDWTLNEANITKLCEGNYDAPQANDREARITKFING